MKLAAVALLLASVLSVSIGAPVDVIRDLILNFREQMPCGFPDWNLPPLAPFVLDTFKLDTDGIRLQVDDLFLEGLDSFDLEELTFALLQFKLGFHFNFREINLKTKYDLEISNLGIDLGAIGGLNGIAGKGDIDLGVKNFSIAGNLAIQFHSGESQDVTLKQFRVALGLDDIKLKITGLLGDEIVSEFLSDVLVSVVETFISEMQDFLGDTVENLVIPVVDKLLVNVTYQDIMDLITGKKPFKALETSCTRRREIEFLFGSKH